MIRRIGLRNFKRFECLDLSTAALTVLAGVNCGGKSTVLQALLLARQAALFPERGIVELNGPDFLQLGEAADVINRRSGSANATVSIEEDQQYSWVLSAEADGSRIAAIKEKPDHYSGALARHGPGFTYLCAERLGPREVLGAGSGNPAGLSVGARGEFTAQVLAFHNLGFRVSEGRLAPNSQSLNLLKQTEAWMSRIVRPLEIQADWFPGTPVTRLQFQTPGAGEWTRAPNMGFGVSYVLPIVVAALRAPTGGLLMVENPEAHLHPAGQSAIGGFLAGIAADGVQVFLESHSDHVLNGIRKFVAEGHAPASLPADQVSIHFFRGENDDGPAVEALQLLPSGLISAWPAGFFDQIETDLADLARNQRRKR